MSHPIRSLALTLPLLTLAFLGPLRGPVEAEEYAPLHCHGAVVDMEGWTRVTCPVDLEPYQVVTLYVWFDREIPAQTVPVLNVTGAAYPLIVNQIRGEAYGAKRVYAKWRVFNPVAIEQAVTLIWLLP